MEFYNPKLLCDNHLLSAHRIVHREECRLFGQFNASIEDGFVTPQDQNIPEVWEIAIIVEYHKMLVEEMERRGIKHRSNMDIMGMFSDFTFPKEVVVPIGIAPPFCDDCGGSPT